MQAVNLDQDVCYKPAAFVIMRTDLSIVDPGSLRLGDAEISASFPPLCRPEHAIAAPDTLRLGNPENSIIFSLLRRPDNIIADPGMLRLGDAEISAQLPCL